MANYLLNSRADVMPNSLRRKLYQTLMVEACIFGDGNFQPSLQQAHILDNGQRCSLVSHRTERRCGMLCWKRKKTLLQNEDPLEEGYLYG
jgi:hypothetical protein